MAEANKKSSTERIWLSEAKALLAEAYGGASGLAEKLLRDEGAAGRLPWGYLRKNGDAADDEFWRYARIDFKENWARVGITFFFVGPGVGRNDGLRSTEYLGIWVSRSHVLALLPEDDPRKHEQLRGAGAWIAAEVKRMKKAEEIPPDIRITDLARDLERRMHKAAANNKSIRAIKARSIENGLREWGLWPITSIK